jgi:hypothetical protein
LDWLPNGQVVQLIVQFAEIFNGRRQVFVFWRFPTLDGFLPGGIYDLFSRPVSECIP